MQHIRQIISGAGGTLMMTLFSHLLSKVFGHVFQEHKLLDKMVHRGSPAGKLSSRIIGWILHLLVGQAFSYLNVHSTKSAKKKPKAVNGLLYGAVDGLIGMAVWRINFLLHPNPPKVPLRKYMVQLFLAHLVFGFFHGLIFEFTKNKLK